MLGSIIRLLDELERALLWACNEVNNPYGVRCVDPDDPTAGPNPH